MKILLAMDASADSRQALDWVARIRWPAGSRILVLGMAQLKDGDVNSASDAGSHPSDLTHAQLEKTGHVVSRAVRTLREVGLSSKGRLAVGNSPPSLIKDICRERVDLVVIGSSSHLGGTRRTRCSVPGLVVTQVPCSILVVKRDRRLPTKQPSRIAARTT